MLTRLRSVETQQIPTASTANNSTHRSSRIPSRRCVKSESSG